MARARPSSLTLAALVLLPGCTLHPPPTGLTLRLGTPPVRQPIFSLQNDNTSIPASLAEMDCFFVSLTGSGVEPVLDTSDLNGAKPECLGIGELSPLVSLDRMTTSGTRFRILSGTPYTATVFGVKARRVGGCGDLTRVDELFDGGRNPSFYVVARGTVRVNRNRPVHLTSTYDPTHPHNPVPHCLPTGLPRLSSQIGGGATQITSAAGSADDGLGSSYLCGTTTGNVTGAAPSGVTEAFVTKYEASGAVAWAKQFSINGGEVHLGGCVADASGVYLSGYAHFATEDDGFVLAIGTDGQQRYLATRSDANKSTRLLGKPRLKNGILYVTGETNAPIGTLYGGATAGPTNLLLSKVDSATGNASWSSRLGNASGMPTSYGRIFVDASGDVLIAGTVQGSLALSFTGTPGTTDLAVAKFSGASGALLWGRELGAGPATTTVADGTMALDEATGDLFLAGGTTGAIQTVAGAGQGTRDIFVARYPSATGQVVFQELGAGNASRLFGPGLGADGSGNLYLSGHVNGALSGFATTLSGTSGVTDAFLARFDSSLRLLGVTQLGGGAAANSSVYGSVTDTTGETVLYGFTSGTVGTVWGGHGARDAFLAKLDAKGAVAWASQLGGGGAVFTSPASFLGNDFSDGLLLFGSTTGSALALDGTRVNAPGSRNLFAVKFDSSTGHRIWTTIVGGGAATDTQADFGSGIFQDAVGDFLVPGSTTGAVAPEIGTQGATDAVLLKFR